MREITCVRELPRPEAVPSVSHSALRIRTLDEIVTRLEMKRPSWQKSRILHLSTQLEDSMFNSKESLAEYGDASTLEARINRHCLLLATRKTTAYKPPAPGAVVVTAVAGTDPGVCSFIATPVDGGTRLGRWAHINAFTGGGGNSRSNSSSFVIGPAPPGPGRPSEKTQLRAELQDHGLVDPAAAGGENARSANGAGKQQVLQPRRGWGGQGGEGRAVRSVAVECGDALQASSYVSGKDNGQSMISPPGAPPPTPLGPAGGWSNARHGSSHGETTEDDMKNGGYLDDDDGSEHGDKSSLMAAAAAAGTTHAAADVAADVVADTPASHSDENMSRERGGGGRRQQEDDEEEDEVAAVIAAASLGEGEPWDMTEHHAVRSGGRQKGGHQLLEGAQQHDSQHHPQKSTEAEVKQHALRLLQCRLLLLTHASSCTKESGCCQLAPLCDSVRRLLDHMQSCGVKRKACDFPHCKSSKAVLQHKHMCTDQSCGLCRSVKDLSQKCFWANARHLHKRRLEESHEQRRKKRQNEGKAVAPPRKLHAEKAKAGKEVCSGLDEAGNDLGDISLGFFLRQAVKMRKKMAASKASHEEDKTGGSVKNKDPTVTAATAAAAPGAGATAVTAAPVRSKRDGDSVAKKGRDLLSRQSSSSPPALTASVSWSSSLVQQQPQHQQRQAQSVGHHLTSAEAESSAAVEAVEAPTEAVGEDDVSGGGPEARSVGPPSSGNSGGGGGGGGGGDRHDGRSAAERGGGLTVVVPPLGAVVGHLRSPSEVMLDEIAESLADTTRKPSFARMQSVQAFLDDHVELRQSASFGDVSAMVEHWMSLEDNSNNDAENFEEDSGMEAFSF